MVLGRLLALTLGVILAGVGLPAHAQELQPTQLTLDSVKRYADVETPIGATLVTQDEGAPIAGAQVLLERGSKAPGRRSESSLPMKLAGPRCPRPWPGT